MTLLDSFIQLYRPQASKYFDLRQRRNEILLINFLSLTQLITALFIPLNISNHLYLSAIIDGIAISIFILIAIFYKLTAKLEIAFFAYVTTFILFTSGMHFIAPADLYANTLWLSPFLFFSFMILSNRFRYYIITIGIISFSLATIIPFYYPNLPLEKSTPFASMITNVFTIFISSIGTALIANITIVEENRITNFLMAQKTYFEELNNRNAILTSMITHDIATPLMIIQHTIKKLNNCPEYKKEHETITKQVSKIIDTITNARQLRASADGKLKLKLNLTPVDLKEICQESVKTLQPKLKEKNISIILNCNTQNSYILAEANSLQVSVINNILSNAIKFSEPNQKIEMYLQPKDAKFTQLIIQDYGIGIPKKILNHIFDFTQPTSRPGTQGESGTGFGMPLAKIFMDMFEGSIQVESKLTTPNRGTKFTLTFKKASSTIE